jgi:hypothetical protein
MKRKDRGPARETTSMEPTIGALPTRVNETVRAIASAGVQFA